MAVAGRVARPRGHLSLASGGERAGRLLEPGFGEEPGGAAGRAAAALGDVGDQQPVLGAGGGDVEQAPLLGEPLGVR